MGLRESDKKDEAKGDSDDSEAHDDPTGTSKQLLTEENIGNYSEKTLAEQVDTIIASLIKKQVTVDTLNVPQLVVLTQDTLQVTALYKFLRDKHKHDHEKKEKDGSKKKHVKGFKV